uniref:Uncharacterized protein n=1 Tax=Anguilla anguilla TaxID=7936 RepID=A0A0E9V5J8_ANGAN
MNSATDPIDQPDGSAFFLKTESYGTVSLLLRPTHPGAK